MVDVRRTEAQNRERVDGKIDPGPGIEANGVFTDPGWQEVVSSGGVRCSVAWAKAEPKA
jgi:hypothetical protein